MPGTFIRLLLLGICLLQASLAAASSCVFRPYDATRSQRLFGPATLVFSGTLGRIAALPKPQDRTGAEAKQLELIETLGTPPLDGLGVFSVDQRYKGESGANVEVAISRHIELGKHYLVYAQTDPQRPGGYRVDLNPCDPSLLPLDDHTRGVLAHLEQLPPAGSGGSIQLYARVQQGSRPWRDATLRFAGPHDELLLRSDAHGMASAHQVAAGTYRLLSEAPSGQILDCGRHTDCREFVVYDRGHEDWQVTLQAPAQLRVNLRDAAGQPARVTAQFEFLDPTTGAVLESMVDMQWSSNVEIGQRFRLQTGRVVVALVLVEVTGKQWQTTVTQRRRIYSGGAKSMASAAQLDLQRGEQSFDFVLPTELQPVLTQFQLIGEQAGLSPMLTGYLYGGHAIGDATEQLWLQLDGLQLWSLPGQTLQLQLYNYRLLDGQSTTWMLRPMTSATEVVHVQPMVQK